MTLLRRFFTCKALFAITLASLLASALAQRYLGHVMPAPDLDFYDYYFAAQAVHDNLQANLYEGATGENPEFHNTSPADSEISIHARMAGFDSVEFYLYPPLLADFLAPFSQQPAHQAAILWRCFNLLLVLVSVLVLARTLRIRILSFEFAVFTFAAYCFWPIHESISDGQLGVVILALWTIGIAAYIDESIILSAAAFALATALKVTPILVVPLFIIWKDRRWLVSYLAILSGLIFAMITTNGWQTVSVYPTVMSAMSGGLPSLQNKSFSSLAVWIYYGKLYTLGSARAVMVNPPRALTIIAKLISGSFYILSLFFVWRRRYSLNRAFKTASIAVFGLVACCVSPVSWRHGYTVALISLAIFWVIALRTPPRLSHIILLTMTTFTLGSLFFDLSAQAHLPQVCKIVLAASWVVFSALFSLEMLYRANAEDDFGAASARTSQAAE